MMKITVTKELFIEMLRGLVESQVTFEAVENLEGLIVVKFTGGY